MVDPKVLHEVNVELLSGEATMARLAYLRATKTLFRAKSSHWFWRWAGKVAPFLLASWTTWRWPWSAGPTIWFPPKAEEWGVLSPGSAADNAFWPGGAQLARAEARRAGIPPNEPLRQLVFDLDRHLGTVDHEIGHVKQIDGAWWRPLVAGVWYFLLPLPFVYSGRWWAERVPYAYNLRQWVHVRHLDREEVLDEVVGSLTTNYALAWPPWEMRAYFEAELAKGAPDFYEYLAGPTT